MKQSFKEYLIAEKSPFANLYMSVVPDTSSGISDVKDDDSKDDDKETSSKKGKKTKVSKREERKKKADKYNKELLNFMKAHQIANN